MGRPDTSGKIVPAGKKWCPKCKEFLFLSQFGRDGKDGYCKMHRRAVRREWNKGHNPDRDIARQSILRKEIIEKLGGKCMDCGEMDQRVLIIYTPGMNMSGMVRYRKILETDWLQKARLYCANCLKKQPR